MYEWVREHFLEIVAVGGGLLLLHWLRHNTGTIFQRHGSKNKMKAYCKHCNWEGFTSRSKPRCGKCKARDLTPIT